MMLTQSTGEKPSTHVLVPAKLRLFIALGLYRSATTWTFNVAAAILSQSASVLKIYSDDAVGVAAQVGEVSGDVLIKSHQPDAGLRLLMRVGAVPTLLSVRDPLDCVASLMRQFGHDFKSAIDFVGGSCDAVLAVLTTCQPLLLRYDRGRDAATVARIASALGRMITPEAAQTIAARFEPDRVKAKIDDLIADETLGDGSDVSRFDPETHWHPNHLGSGQTGMHADMLTPSQIAAVLYRTRIFRRVLAYKNESDRPRLASPAAIYFGSHGEGAAYCGDGFSIQETSAIWTDSHEAELVLPLQGPAGIVSLTLVGSFGPFATCVARAAVSVYVNGYQKALISGCEMRNETHRVTFNAAGANQLDVKLQFYGLLSPGDIGAGADTRQLGLYLAAISLIYESAEEPTIQ